tara:strand:+ start:250 stop:630 length:381 start_codon:yes stop_codon:yes gene_type:complete
MANKLDKTDILMEYIINIIQDAKGQEIISLDLRSIDSSICKYFIVCTGTSNTHVNSIEGHVKKKISQELGEKPKNTEGKNIAEWILMDYYDIIVHIFQEQTRKFYNIEDFWGDAKIKNYREETIKT